MGTGARMQRAALGQTLGESLGVQQHTQAMIPILQEQTEMELEIREKTFAQELEQTKRLYLLANQLESQPQPVFITATETTKPKPNYAIIAGLAGLTYFLFIKK